MLDVALKFLVKELNVFLFNRTGNAEMKAELARLVDDAGKWTITENHVGLSLVQVEEERTLKAQRPESALIDGQNVMLEPELRVNLHVLCAARFQQYDQALHYLAHVLTFFQANSHFDPTRFPALDPRIRKLTLELLPLNYEQTNQLWAFLGSRHLPSVVYRARLLALQDAEKIGVRPAVGAVDSQVRVV